MAVDPEIFLNEITEFDEEFGTSKRARVDFRCPVILPKHRKEEQLDNHLRHEVGSTQSGTGVAQAEFRLTFLSLALTRDYPYSTSDNCTTAALADDVGLNWRYIKEVILVVKALPSRVGGGPLPFQISEEEQDARNIAEFGVRTGRRRKKSSGISWDHLEEAVMLNGPTQIALTFCDHLDPDIRDKLKITPRVQGLIDKIEEVAQVPVTLVETGKRFDAIYDLS